jgi:intron-binding protein aquarius
VTKLKKKTKISIRYREPFVPQVGLVYVRGCEIEGMLDHLGRIIEEGPDPRPKIPGGQRTFRVWYLSNIDVGFF